MAGIVFDILLGNLLNANFCWKKNNCFLIKN